MRPPAIVPRPEAAPGSGLAAAGLVLSLLSLGLLVLSLGLSFALSLPLAAGAWLCASRARRTGGTGRNQTARVLAMIGVGLSIASMVIWLVLIAAGFSIEDFQHDLQRELERQRSRGR